MLENESYKPTTDKKSGTRDLLEQLDECSRAASILSLVTKSIEVNGIEKTLEDLRSVDTKAVRGGDDFHRLWKGLIKSADVVVQLKRRINEST